MGANIAGLIASEYIDNILRGKQTTGGGSSTASAVASAKGTTLSQALAQARVPPVGRSVLRMIRPAPPKSGVSVSTTTTPTVTVRAVPVSIPWQIRLLSVKILKKGIFLGNNGLLFKNILTRSISRRGWTILHQKIKKKHSLGNIQCVCLFFLACPILED